MYKMAGEVIVDKKSSKENLREIDWVISQVKAELTKLQSSIDGDSEKLFYEIKEETVNFRMDVVQKYLESLKNKSWAELTKENSNSSAWIMAVQIALESMGYDVGNVDGILGDRTKAAVRNFESKYGLKHDAGLPGNEVINKILDILSNPDNSATGSTNNSATGSTNNSATGSTNNSAIGSPDITPEEIDSFDTIYNSIENVINLINNSKEVDDIIHIEKKENPIITLKLRIFKYTEYDIDGNSTKIYSDGVFKKIDINDFIDSEKKFNANKFMQSVKDILEKERGNLNEDEKNKGLISKFISENKLTRKTYSIADLGLDKIENQVDLEKFRQRFKNQEIGFDFDDFYMFEKQNDTIYLNYTYDIKGRNKKKAGNAGREPKRQIDISKLIEGEGDNRKVSESKFKQAIAEDIQKIINSAEGKKE